jgi:pilus assembly protein Flp/PilA
MTRVETLCDRARESFARFGADESGTTAIEYAVIAAGVSVAIVGVVTSVGSQLKTTFYDKLASLFP